MIADVIITTCGRKDQFEQSLRSFCHNTDRDDYRLTIVVDGEHYVDSFECIDYNAMFDRVIVHRDPKGLGPSINEALSAIDTTKAWEGRSKVPLTVYVQDDVLYSKGWLQRLSKMFFLLENQYNLGFASGIECVEHPIKRDIGGGMLLKDWIRATCMMARHEYWMSMLPIPRIDIETGRERGRPNDGLGSGVDWHFVRVHENSVCRTGKTNLIIPGLLQHMGYDSSTWLDRDLPESEGDIERIRQYGR